MNKSNNLMSNCSSPSGLMAIDEVVYRRQVFYNGGGGCCPPRRSKSDINMSSPRCFSGCPQATMKVSCSPSVRCSPCNRSVIPPHNTPCSSPYMSPMVGPINITSNSSKLSLPVPKMVNRSRSASSLDDRGYDTGPLSSTRIGASRSNISHGKSDFFMGSSSISRISKN